NLSAPYAELFTNLRFKVQSTVSSFKEINYEKYFGQNFAKHFQDIGIDENHWNFYELNLKNQSASMQAQIAVHQDYPRISPLFALSVNWKHERNFLNDEAIRDMEREINLFKDNFMFHEDVESGKSLRRSLSGLGKHGLSEKNYDILAKQVNHLMICFDVYLESEAFYLNDSEFHRLKLFPNSVRGRDRKRPYSYLANKDLFLQRMLIDIANE
ncbi:THO complex subunit 5 -like protein, partial [Brachionus plicatilis]